MVNHKIPPHKSILEESFRRMNKATQQVRGMAVYTSKIVEQVVD